MARSDAALAEIMGVPGSAIGNWRRRLSIPADHAGWFTSELIHEVVARNGRVPRQCGPMVRSGVLRFLSRANGNPFKLASGNADLAHGRAFGALAAIAALAWRITDINVMEDEQALDAMADRLEEVQGQVAEGTNLRGYQ